MGEISVVTGYSGHGKSAWLNQCILGLLKKEKTMIASFEMLPKATLGRMCQQTGEALPSLTYIKDFLGCCRPLLLTSRFTLVCCSLMIEPNR